MTNPSQDAAAVAKGLTKAQRAAVLSATYSDGNGVWHPAGWYVNADRRVRYNLALLDVCTDYSRASNPLTPFGKRVRAILRP